MLFILQVSMAFLHRPVVIMDKSKSLHNHKLLKIRRIRKLGKS